MARPRQPLSLRLAQVRPCGARAPWPPERPVRRAAELVLSAACVARFRMGKLCRGCGAVALRMGRTPPPTSSPAKASSATRRGIVGTFCLLHPAPRHAFSLLPPAPSILPPASCLLYLAPCFLHPASSSLILHPASCILPPPPYPASCMHPESCPLPHTSCTLQPHIPLLHPAPPTRRGRAEAELGSPPGALQSGQFRLLTPHGRRRHALARERPTHLSAAGAAGCVAELAVMLGPAHSPWGRPAHSSSLSLPAAGAAGRLQSGQRRFKWSHGAMHSR